MKFDTKIASPLPSTTTECYLQDNKFILDQAFAPTPVTPEHDEKLGREVFYEPHVFFSPVLASQRLIEVSEDSTTTSTITFKKRLLTAESVDSLSQLLDTLCLGGAPNVSPTEATVSPKSLTFEAESAASDSSSSTASMSGRFVQSVFSTKAHCNVPVTRSCRLVAAGL
jgi:hypothetical protein